MGTLLYDSFTHGFTACPILLATSTHSTCATLFSGSTTASFRHSCSCLACMAAAHKRARFCSPASWAHWRAPSRWRSASLSPPRANCRLSLATSCLSGMFAFYRGLLHLILFTRYHGMHPVLCVSISRNLVHHRPTVLLKLRSHFAGNRCRRLLLCRIDFQVLTVCVSTVFQICPRIHKHRHGLRRRIARSTRCRHGGG